MEGFYFCFIFKVLNLMMTWVANYPWPVVLVTLKKNDLMKKKEVKTSEGETMGLKLFIWRIVVGGRRAINTINYYIALY